MNNEVKESKGLSIIKDAAVLFIITLIAGFALGLVYEITAPVIAKQNLQAKMNAYQAVYPEAVNFSEDAALSEKMKEAPALLQSKGYENISIDEVLVASDQSGNPIGHVVVVTTGEGYGGDITVSVGYSDSGTVKGIEILSMNETAGLGAKAQNKEFKEQFAEKNVTEFTYTKSGAKAENEIDALSGATITTRAVVNAVNAGLYFLNNLAAENVQGGE
ncbi:MAG: Ion-translocating oxidoreductase complex subunit G [Lachnoclostridium sp.]|jgi:Na+-translocating ferredoxin:NAD+ oxidoreductase subunit G